MHLQPILYFRERITELSEQAKFGPSHTILPLSLIHISSVASREAWMVLS